MKNTKFLPVFVWLAVALALPACFGVAEAQTSGGRSIASKGPGNVIVHPRLGGTIFGFDIDQNGTEGLLSEAIGSGECPYATETFDQQTGHIIKVVRKGKSTGCGDDDVTWGIAGTSTGLVEHQHSPSFDHLRMTFPLLNPLDGNRVTGRWVTPEKKSAEIYGVSRNQGAAMNAFQVHDFSTMMLYVFGSDVAKNSFGPVVQITSTLGVIGLNTNTDTAVLSIEGNPFGPSSIAQVDLQRGKIKTFEGVGSGGQSQGLAVDSADNMAVTTSYEDSSVEFYDLAKHTGLIEVLPDCSSPACSGFDVEFDPVHKLFLVAQPISSQVANESTIYVYDTKGTLRETLNGFNFYTQRFDVFPVHMAIHPADRSGFVDVTNSIWVGAIQSFMY